MPSVNCFKLDGLRCIIHTRDHQPPHFHAIRTGEWEIVIFILTTTFSELDYRIVWSLKLKKIPAHYSNVLIGVVVKNRIELMKEWQLLMSQTQNQKQI